MKLFLCEWPGVCLGAYALIHAEDREQAITRLLEWLTVAQFTDKPRVEHIEIREVVVPACGVFPIWNGDY